MSPGDQPTSQVKVLEFEDLPPAEPPPDEPNTSNNISDILDEIQFAYNDNDLKPAIACLSFDKRTDKLLETDSAKLPYIFKAEGTSIQQNDIFNCTPDDFELGDISEDKNETFVNGKIAVNKDYEEQQEHSNTEHSVRTSTTTWQPSLQKIPERSKITFDSKILVPNNSNSRKTLQGQLRVTNKALNQHQIAYTDGPTCNTADGKLKQLKQKLFQLSILPSTIKGVYKHHLKIQNDSGANRCVTNVKTLLINFKAILPKSRQRGNKLTRRKLKHRNDWQQWMCSEWKQLDQYHSQETFGEPCMLPPKANILDLLWTYNIKDDGTLKARCVCNGRPSNKNTAIFGHTFAKSLDQVGSRIFWAIAAIKNMIVRGADASNAFAEADAPKIPLYVRIDQPYRDWWNKRYPDKPLPDNYVLPVKKALQGHPEAPRAWATLINRILITKLHLQPTKHEPCLYYGTFQGKEILFLRQVDDFDVVTGLVDIDSVVS